MQGPRAGEVALQGEIDGYERMVYTFAFSTKAYWALWGLLGQPMIVGVDAWQRMQRAYLESVRNGFGVRGASLPLVSLSVTLPMPLLSAYGSVAVVHAPHP